MEVTTSEANQTEYPAGQDPARWRVLIVLLTALFMSLLSVSIVNVAPVSYTHLTLPTNGW